MDNSQTTVRQQSDNRGLSFRHAEMKPPEVLHYKQATEFTRKRTTKLLTGTGIHQNSPGANNEAANFCSVGTTNFSRACREENTNDVADKDSAQL